MQSLNIDFVDENQAAPTVTPGQNLSIDFVDEPAHGLAQSFQAGYQESATGLALRGKLPDIHLDHNDAKWWERAAFGAGQFATDFPLMAMGGVMGSMAGAALGSEVPVLGTAAGGLLGGGAGAMGVPAAIREAYVQAYQKGEITSAGDFLSRANFVLSSFNKQALTGLLTAGMGKVTGMGAEAMKFGQPATMATVLVAEGGTMVMTPAALEGHLPEPQDALDAAILMVGLKAAHAATGKVLNTYAKTGKTPIEIAADAKNDPQIVDDLAGAPKITEAITQWKAKSVEPIDAAGISTSADLAARVKDTLGEDHFATVLLDRMGERLKNYKVEVLSDAEWAYRGYSADRQAQTNPKTMTIEFRGGITKEGALHEMMHESTQAELKINPVFLSDVRAVMDNVKGAIKSGAVGDTSVPEMRRVRAAMKNEAEFVAYGLSNPEVINVLRRVRGQGSQPTLFTQFVSAVARAFGFKQNDYTALHDLIRAVDRGATDTRPYEGGTISDYIAGRKPAAQSAAAPEATATPAEATPEAATTPVQVAPETPTTERPAAPKALSPEKQAQLDALTENYNKDVELVKRSAANEQEKGKSLKGLAMRFAAEKRKITGELTANEQAKEAKRLAGNYTGKEVSVDGRDGVVERVAFGKVRVKFEDGQVLSIEPEKVQKRQKAPEPAAEPVAPAPEATAPEAPAGKPRVRVPALVGNEIPRAYEPMAAEQAAERAFSGEKAQQVLDHPFADIPESRVPHQINLTTIDGPDALKALMARMTTTYAEDVAKQTRGTVSHAQTEAEATQKLVDMLGPDGRDMKTTREPGTAANAVELKIRGDLLMQSANEAAEKIAAVKKAGVNATDAMRAEALEAIHRAAMVQAEFTGAAAEVGRALNYLGRLKAVRAGTERYADLVDIYKGDPEKLLTLALDMDNPAAVLRFAREANKATTMDKVVEAWKAGLVSGPITQVANLMGNTTFMVTRPLIDAVAVVFNNARGADERMSAVEPFARVAGNLQGTMDALRMAGMVLRTGQAYGKAPDAHLQAIEGLKGEIIRSSFRLLSSADAFFRVMNERGEAFTLAARQAAKEGLNPATHEYRDRVAELALNPSETMQEKISEAGARFTFNAPVGKIGRNVNNILNAAPVLKFVIPFVQTPVNVLKEMTRLTPAAPILSEWRDAIAKGGPEADKAMAEMVVGSALSAVVFTYALSGSISGAGDPDPKKRAADMAAGWQPYSIKIGNKWYSYQRLQPIGTLMGMAADAAAIHEHMTPQESDQIPKIIATAFGNAVTNQTFLQGIANIANALQEPDRFGARWINGLAGSAVPAIVGQTAQMLDPYKREVDSAFDAIKARIPGVSQSLMPKRDEFGEPVPATDRVGAITPITVSKVSEDKARLEMSRLRIGVNKAPDHIDLPAGHDPKLGKVPLTPEQQDVFASTTGKLAHQILTQLVYSPGWDALPDTAQHTAVEKVFEAARKAGKAAAVPPSQIIAESNRIAAELQLRMQQK